MKGKELKEILIREGISLSELSRLLGFANDQRLHSALKAEDVKSGLIEAIAKVTNKSIGFFYARDTDCQVPTESADPNNCDMKERILQFIASLGITTAEFERSCGLSNGSVSRMGFNTRQLTLDRISATYPALSITWLRTGEGGMLVGQPSESAAAALPASLSCKTAEERVSELERQNAVLTRSLDLLTRQLEALLERQRDG